MIDWQCMTPPVFSFPGGAMLCIPELLVILTLLVTLTWSFYLLPPIPAHTRYELPWVPARNVPLRHYFHPEMFESSAFQCSQGQSCAKSLPQSWAVFSRLQGKVVAGLMCNLWRNSR